MPAVDEAVVVAEVEADDEVCHCLCYCNTDFALCGRYVADDPLLPGLFDEDDAESCVLCSLTDECPRCGS